MIRRREIPVYLFTGLLESGKSTFIRETLQEGEFEDGDRTLYLMCEEGIEECDQALLERNKMTVVPVEEKEELTGEFLLECEKKYHPDRASPLWHPVAGGGEGQEKGNCGCSKGYERSFPFSCFLGRRIV